MILTQHITGGLNHALDAMWPHSQLVAGA
jgi:hypothetical protein